MMKYLNKIVILLFLFSLSFGTWQCTSYKATNQDKEYSFRAFSGVGDVYCQPWTSGIQGGGSGIDIFIPVTSELPKNLLLDSVYFRGQMAKLEIEPNNVMVYVGHFKTDINQPNDIIMSSNPNDEYGNVMPIKDKESPFDLSDTECIVSYSYLRKTQYYKLNVAEKEPLGYPSAPANKQ